MKQEWLAFLSAVQFLTRLPVPDHEWEEGRLDRAAKWFPLVGGLVGAICAAVFLGAQSIGLGISVSIILAVLAGIVATGGLHEDGLADTADGLFGGQTPERRLAIMKDSAIGSYGTLALILILLLRVALYREAAALSTAAVALGFVAAHTLSRAAMVGVLWSLPYARDEASAKVAPLTAPATVTGILTTALVAAIAALSIAVETGIAAAVTALAVCAASAVALRLLYARKLGGWTGDTAGATQQTSEVAVLLGVCAWI